MAVLSNVDVVRHVFSTIITLGALSIIFFGIGAGYAALPGDRDPSTDRAPFSPLFPLPPSSPSPCLPSVAMARVYTQAHPPCYTFSSSA